MFSRLGHWTISTTTTAPTTNNLQIHHNHRDTVYFPDSPALFAICQLMVNFLFKP